MYTSLYGARLSSVPTGDRSANHVGVSAKCVSGSCLAGSGSASLFFVGDDAGLRTIVSIENFSKIVRMLMA